MPILPEHKELLLTQSESKTLPEWIEFFDSQYTKNQIYSFCYRNGKYVKKIDSQTKSNIQSQNSRKYNINQDYFKTWSHNMAYMLGFWFADGCIYGGKMFDITQSNKDKYILKCFAKELGYEGNLYDYVDRQASRLNFSCKVIYDDIITLGGKENKSKDVTFPNIPEIYLSDFVRGFFDGDGCVTWVKGNRINTSFTSASPLFINGLWQVLRDKAGVEGGSYDPSSYSLRFGKRDSLKIGEFMYGSNPELFLKRKREKFNI